MTVTHAMNLDISSHEHLEIRANIKVCKEIDKTQSETYKLLKQTRGENCVCRALVFKWFRRFSDGRQSLEDDAGRGWNSTIGPSAVTSIEDKLKADCRMTVRELSESADVSYGTAHSTLTTKLNMRKVHARWVPRILTDFERDRRVKETDANALIRKYPAEYYRDIIFNQSQRNTNAVYNEVGSHQMYLVPSA